MFRRGQKVVCVWARRRWYDGMPWWKQLSLRSADPVLGGVYVVAEVINNHPGDPLFHLEGLSSNYWWTSRGFRPIVDNELDRLSAIALEPKPRAPVLLPEGA